MDKARPRRLTHEQVQDIFQSCETITVLAKRFDCYYQTISRIKKRTTHRQQIKNILNPPPAYSFEGDYSPTIPFLKVCFVIENWGKLEPLEILIIAGLSNRETIRIGRRYRLGKFGGPPSTEIKRPDAVYDNIKSNYITDGE